MKEKKIAIACQGGGSQTAFTAGVLMSLLKNKNHESQQIVSLSGTSGGAICAALAWQGLLKWNQGAKADVYQSLKSFWRDNGAENILERFLNNTLINYAQLVDHGVLPEWKTSPYASWRQTWTTTLQVLMPQFYDFKGLLKNYINFNEIGGRMELWSAPDKRASKAASGIIPPVLVIGAADVQTGEFRKFLGKITNGESKGENVDEIEALLASAADPSLFQAVETGGGVFWDGLFSDNPPTDELIDDDIVGKENIPDQLWVIQINPKTCEEIPRTTHKIIDRRNEMIGNASLFQDLQHICRVNRWVHRKAYTEAYQKDHNLKIVDIYIIQMAEDFQRRLSYVSKLDRDSEYLQALFAHGDEMGRRFLENQESMQFDWTEKREK